MATSSSFSAPTRRLPRATASLHHHHHNSSFISLCFPSKPKSKQLPSLSFSSLHAPPPAPLRVTCKKSSKAAAVSEELWEKSILKSTMPALVEFYASWCGPCQMVHRVIDEIAGEYDGKLSCFVLNTDTDLQIAEQYEIKAVPVVLVFKNGEKKETIVGTMPKEFYIAAIERVLKL